MASIPPRPTSQQRHVSGDARNQTEVASQGSSPRRSSATNAESPSPDAVKSQPVLLNGLTSNSHEPPPTESQAQESAPATSVTLPNGDVAEPRKCWICFSDETEDSPMSSEWRSPCPCALTAHESCLLDWVADLQAPNSRKRLNAEIRCPQCKSEIVVVRPRNVVVDTVNFLERAAGRVIVPGVITVFAGCIWTGCLVYGMNTVYLVFGTEDATHILADGRVSASEDEVASIPNDAMTMARLLLPFTASKSGWSWGLSLGLPLIPVILVLSRTTLADSVLPVVPIIYFAIQGDDGEEMNLFQWPPSASMAIAALPYVRAAYNEFYERAFGERLRKWTKEVQPRAGETEQDGDNPDRVPGEDRVEELGDGEVVMEIDVELNVMDGDEDEDEAQQQGPAPGAGAPAVQGEEDAAAAPPGENEANAAAAQQPPAPLQRANTLMMSTGQVADTIIGAFLFPAISSAMGSLLKRVLPKAWTTPPSSTERRASGLLQTKWGRSIVGGCLFVVLKDAVVLYARWKQAQIHRQRRVLDYDKAKGRPAR